MFQDELEGRTRRIVAAHLSLPGRPRVARHNQLQEATAEFDDEGHPRTDGRRLRMNNKPFDAGLRDLVDAGVYRRTKKGYWLVSDQERVAEIARLLRAPADAMKGFIEGLEDFARLFRLLHPREAKPSPRSEGRRQFARGLPLVRPGDETWGEYRERVRQIAELLRPRWRATAWRETKRD